MAIEKLQPDTANKEFIRILGKNKYVICLYHWKLCGHCVLFRPTWNQIVNKYKNSLMMVDIELNAMKQLENKYMMQMFPSIVVYHNGKKHIEYNGNREFQSIDNFMKTFVEKTPHKNVKSKKTKILTKQI